MILKLPNILSNAAGIGNILMIFACVLDSDDTSLLIAGSNVILSVILLIVGAAVAIAEADAVVVRLNIVTFLFDSQTPHSPLSWFALY